MGAKKSHLLYNFRTDIDISFGKSCVIFYIEHIFSKEKHSKGGKVSAKLVAAVAFKKSGLFESL